MSRTASYLTVIAVLALFAAGCGGPRTTRKPRDRGPTPEAGKIEGIDFSRYWPRDEVLKLTPAERAKLLELALAGMRGTNWAHAGDVLVALGKDAVPALIQQVESSEETAAAAGPLPVTRVKTLGELSHDVLLRSVQYHSNYKGQLPARKRAAWEEWWKANGAKLKLE